MTVKYKVKRDKKYQLRKQISIFFLSAIMFSVIIVYFLSNKFILDKYNSIIEKQGQDSMKLAINGLSSQIIELEDSIEDYSTWDTTYEYVLNKNNRYIKYNYSDETFNSNKWNLFYIFDENKNLIFGKEFDLYKKIEVNKSQELVDFVKNKDELFKDSQVESELINSPKGKLIISSYPIIGGNDREREVGRIMCARYLDESLIKTIGDNVLIDLSIYDNESGLENIESINYNVSKDIKADIWIDKSNHSYKSIGKIYDSHGEEVINLVSNMDMTIIQAGKSSIYKYMFIISIILLISFISLLWLIDGTIFKRLAFLIDSVDNIEKNNDFSQRINVAHNDEISILEKGFNNLLSTVERTQREILYQAKYDQLTETFNRGAFFDDVQLNLSNEIEKGNKSVVVFIDIDGFKDINDSLGHSTGDYILVNVSARIKETLYEYNPVISRFGGDEFVIFLPNMESSEYIDVICKELLKKIKQPMYIKGKACEITCSIGASISVDHGNTVDDLINNADIAMYYVKKNNKNNFVIYNEDMRSKISLEMMQEALESKEFILYYQKQVDVNTGKTEGAEALIRWNNKEKGLISPVEFISLAEETGFIVPLGQWILEEACKQCKQWNETVDEDFRVSVNVSSIQFMEKAFVDMVINTLKSTGINPINLELEITESVALYKEEEVISKLLELKKLGVRVSIDDFGTGYSSLKYLQKFKIDGLKIDKAFIDNINENSSIAKSIISMAENLGVYVIAEGVETIEQVNCLKALNCKYIQGYYYGKPVPPEIFSLKSS